MATQSAAKKAANLKIAEIKKETKVKITQIKLSHAAAVKGAATQEYAAIKAANDTHKANLTQIRSSFKATKESLEAQRDDQAGIVYNQESEAIAYIQDHGVVGL